MVYHTYALALFSPTQGILALKFAMSRPIVQLVILEFDVVDFVQNFPSHAPMLSELEANPDTFATKTLDLTETFWENIEKRSEEEREIFIRACIESIIRQTLKLPASDRIEEHGSFSDIGLDSLMAVEMRNKLQQILGQHLSLNPTSLLDYPTLAELSKFLTSMTMSFNLNEPSTNKTKNVNRLDLAIEDSVLPETISQIGEPVIPSQIKSILLTGVTGHLAPHLLNHLTKNGSTAVVCLIRAKDLLAAEKKLADNLKKNNITLEAPDNITVILGDITQEYLGMTKADYETLAKCIEAVFHCAVKANHVEKYQLSNSGKDIRSVNVLGTLEVLRFACAYKTKRVFFASSYVAANVFTSDGFISEELPSQENYGDGLDHGYTLTKFVGEKLMKQAIERGIPCTVLRYCTLSGHSETGHFTADPNFLNNMLLSALQIKIFRDIPSGWHTMPVDIAAKISASILFNDEAETGLYNIFDSNPMRSEMFVKIATEMGLVIKMVDAKEFNDKIFKSPLMSVFKEAFGEKDPMEMITGFTPVAKSTFTQTRSVFNLSTKLTKAVKGVETLITSPSKVLKLQLQFAKTSGMFKKLNIEFQQ